MAPYKVSQQALSHEQEDAKGYTVTSRISDTDKQDAIERLCERESFSRPVLPMDWVICVTADLSCNSFFSHLPVVLRHQGGGGTGRDGGRGRMGDRGNGRADIRTPTGDQVVLKH